MRTYKLRNVPAFTHLGKHYPARTMVTLICSRGLRWDGGEYPTRAEAVAAGERQTGAAA